MSGWYLQKLKKEEDKLNNTLSCLTTIILDYRSKVHDAVGTRYNDFIMWLKEVLLKILLLWNRNSTKHNLVRCYVLTINDQFCTEWCRCIEDTYHLFVSCVFMTIFGIWLMAGLRFFRQHVRIFYCISSFLWFGRSFGTIMFSSQDDLVGSCLCYLCLCLALKKERNKHIFQQKEESIHSIREQVKVLVFWWFKTKFVSFDFHYNVWRQNPLMCLIAVT